MEFNALTHSLIKEFYKKMDWRFWIYKLRCRQPNGAFCSCELCRMCVFNYGILNVLQEEGLGYCLGDEITLDTATDCQEISKTLQQHFKGLSPENPHSLETLAGRKIELTLGPNKSNAMLLPLPCQMIEKIEHNTYIAQFLDNQYKLNTAELAELNEKQVWKFLYDNFADFMMIHVGCVFSIAMSEEID